MTVCDCPDLVAAATAKGIYLYHGQLLRSKETGLVRVGDLKAVNGPAIMARTGTIQPEAIDGVIDEISRMRISLDGAAVPLIWKL